MEKYDYKKVHELTERLNNWTFKNKAEHIEKQFNFNNFQEAIKFTNKVAELAENANHHPDIKIHDYNKVTICLSTHEAEGLTGKDFDLAEQIDNL